jgi:hypothetical protein
MEALEARVDCDWKSGDMALGKLKETIAECVEQGLIVKGDVEAMSMAIWSLVHGLVSLAIRNRFEKLVSAEQLMPMIRQSLNWFLNVVDATGKKG